MPRTPNAAEQPTPQPWWRVGFMWIVIGGPLTVVVASFATLGLAITHPDPVITSGAKASQADLPAIQARNHATTPKP